MSIILCSIKPRKQAKLKGRRECRKDEGEIILFREVFNEDPGIREKNHILMQSYYSCTK